MTPGKVRIIGGAWRGRSIKVIDSPGLRPTADRTRETLFNCLGQRVDDLICFDMFAGTGALGFEALSRGAQKHPPQGRPLIILRGKLSRLTSAPPRALSRK